MASIACICHFETICKINYLIKKTNDSTEGFLIITAQPTSDVTKDLALLCFRVRFRSRNSSLMVLLHTHELVSLLFSSLKVMFQS